MNPINVLMWHATFSEFRSEVMLSTYLKEFPHRIVNFECRILIAYTLPDVHPSVYHLTNLS